MKNHRLAFLLLAALSFCLSCRSAPGPDAGSKNANAPAARSGTDNRAATQPLPAPETHLKVGDTAPDFTLTDTNGQTVRLSDFRGKKNVALAFYVMAFTGG